LNRWNCEASRSSDADAQREDFRLIHPVSNTAVQIPLPVSPSGGAEAMEGAASFKEILLDAVRQAGAGGPVEAIGAGGEASGAETLAAVGKADDALRLMIEIQNRMVRAFQEVQNIRV
jgi:flagellar hook-basal body complex protein FliE